MPRARLMLAPFDPYAELAAFAASRQGAGALASFVGVARAEGASGPVVRLVLEHYPGLTEQSLSDIAAAAAERFPLSGVLVIHRAGEIAPGEPIVLAAAAAAHRRPALEAVDYLMDRLKTEAAFWKREEGPAGGRWVEPTQADRAARARWEL